MGWFNRFHRTFKASYSAFSMLVGSISALDCKMAQVPVGMFLCIILRSNMLSTHSKTTVFTTKL